MKKLLGTFALLIGFSTISLAEQLKTVYNPFTGKLDYITALSSSSLPSGSTQYIQNTNTLQAGATFYVSSGTVQNIFSANQLAVGGLEADAGAYITVPGGLGGSGAAVKVLGSGQIVYGVTTANTLTYYTLANANVSAKLEALTSTSGGRLQIQNNSGIGQPELPFTWLTQGTIAGPSDETTATLYQSSLTVTNLVANDNIQGVDGSFSTSLQVAGQSVCRADGTNCPAAGSSSASTLAVTTGTSTGFTGPAISSPTAVLNLQQDQFKVTLQTNATAFIELLSSSVTLQGRITGAGNTFVSGSIVGTPTIDISTGTNLTASGAAVLVGDNVGVSLISLSTGVTSSLPAASIAAGNLGASVVASSISMNMNYVATGNWDLGGATGLEIPNGTNPTVDATGECALDTTDNALVCFDGLTANVVAVATQSVTVTISSGTTWNGLAIPVWRAPTDMAVTITKVMAESLPAGTTVLYQLDERAFGSINSAGTDVFTVAFSSANGTGTTETALSNPGIAAQNSLVFETPAAGAGVSSPSMMTLTIYYKRDRE